MRCDISEVGTWLLYTRGARGYFESVLHSCRRCEYAQGFNIYYGIATRYCMATFSIVIIFFRGCVPESKGDHDSFLYHLVNVHEIYQQQSAEMKPIPKYCLKRNTLKSISQYSSTKSQFGCYKRTNVDSGVPRGWPSLTVSWFTSVLRMQ